MDSNISYIITHLVRSIVPCYMKSRGRLITFYSREKSAVENTIPIFSEEPDHVTIGTHIHLRCKYHQNAVGRIQIKSLGGGVAYEFVDMLGGIKAFMFLRIETSGLDLAQLERRDFARELQALYAYWARWYVTRSVTRRPWVGGLWDSYQPNQGLF